MADENEQSTSLSELLEDLDCSICYESNQLLLLPCQHRFCANCIGTLTTESHEVCCPDCRQVFQCPASGFPVCRLARAVREHVQQHMMHKTASQDSMTKGKPSVSASDDATSDTQNVSSTDALDIECQECGKKLEARCSICRQFLCFRCFAKSPCSASTDTRHDPIDFEYVVEEADMILSTWRYNVDNELSAIKNKREKRDNQAIVDATVDAIDIQVNPVERILMIEHITKTIATGKTLAPETDLKEKKPKEDEVACKSKQIASESELQSKEKLSEEIEKRLAATNVMRRLSKQKSKKKKQALSSSDASVVIQEVTAIYSFDTEGREDCVGLVEGEAVIVVAEDTGSGWTTVVNSQGCSGFVPTSYLDISTSSQDQPPPQEVTTSDDVSTKVQSSVVPGETKASEYDVVKQSCSEETKVAVRPKDISVKSERANSQRMSEEIKQRIGHLFGDENRNRELGTPPGMPAEATLPSADFPSGVTGKTTALYAYTKGDSDRCVDMRANEEVQVVEEDSGDGWTVIINSNGQQGRVPTSYLHLL